MALTTGNIVTGANLHLRLAHCTVIGRRGQGELVFMFNIPKHNRIAFKDLDANLKIAP